MLFSLLLATVLALDPPPQGPATSAAFAEAIQAANDGRDAEALSAFQQLASANPNDHEARMWIARLHARMGHQDLAEPVYRSVLLEDPGNVDAMLGVAIALLARDEPAEAIEVLEVAEELDPTDDQVLAALGRAHRQTGGTARAIDYFERAVSIAPTEQHRLSLEGARRSYLHRIETRGSSETFDGATTPDSRSGDLSVNVRLNDTWRVFGRGQVQRKFAETEQRGGGGAEWRWKPTTTLRAHALIGPDNVVMPEGDYLGEVQYTYQDATWTASVRHFDFTGARTTVLSPAVAWVPALPWIPEGRLSVALRYALSWTETANTLTSVAGQSVHVRAAYQVYPRISVLGAYAAGVEDFENFSIDRIGDFRANTLSGGLRFDLPTLTALIANYERQWQARSPDMARVSVFFLQSF
jgi:Flp pilus assembly protein TadD